MTRLTADPSKAVLPLSFTSQCCTVCTVQSKVQSKVQKSTHRRASLKMLTRNCVKRVSEFSVWIQNLKLRRIVVVVHCTSTRTVPVPYFLFFTSCLPEFIYPSFFWNLFSRCLHAASMMRSGSYSSVVADTTCLPLLSVF